MWQPKATTSVALFAPGCMAMLNFIFEIGDGTDLALDSSHADRR